MIKSPFKEGGENRMGYVCDSDSGDTEGLEQAEGWELGSDQ